MTHDGRLLFTADNQIWSVDVGGDLVAVAGSTTDSVNRSSGVSPLSVYLGVVDSFAQGPDGTLYVSMRDGLRSVRPGLPGFSLTGYSVPSADGSQVYRFDPSGRHTATVDAITGTTLLSFGYDSAGLLASITDRDGQTTTIERGADGTPSAIVAPTGERTAVTLDADGNLAALAAPGGLQTTFRYASGGLLTQETDAAGGLHEFAYDSKGLLTQDLNPDGESTAVAGAAAGENEQTQLTTPLAHQVTYLNGQQADGSWLNTRTDEAGGVTSSTIAPDGTDTGSLPNGRVTTVAPGADPRFGLLAPYNQTASVREPSGLTLTAATSRTVTLNDSTDPFSVATWTQSLATDGATSTQTYDAASHTITSVSAAGRQSVDTIDSKLRTTSALDDPALDPRSFTYNDRGLLTATAQGSEHAAYVYDAENRPTSLTDASGQTTSYTYDAAGSGGHHHCPRRRGLHLHARRARPSDLAHASPRRRTTRPLDAGRS